MSLRVRSIHSVDELRGLATAWNDLCLRSANELSTTPLWLLLWWDIFGKEDLRRLHVLAIFDGQRLVGLAPLLVRPALYRRVLPVRRLELLGSGEREADEICSDYNGVISEPGYEVPVLDAVVSHLAQQRSWEHLVLHGLDGESPLVPLLERALNAAGMPTERKEVSICPYIPLPKTFDQYLETLTPKRRRFVRKGLRDFEAWAPDHSFVVAQDAVGLAQGRRVLQQLHGTRWAESGGAGVFVSNKFDAFHQHLMQELLARNALQLGWLVGNNRPLAVLYNFVWKGRVYNYQSGRAVDLPNTIRVGILSHLYAIQHSIALGLEQYDFLAGRQRYKLELSLASRPLVAIHAWRKPWLHLGSRAVDESIRLLRAAQKKWRPSSVPVSPDESAD